MSTKMGRSTGKNCTVSINEVIVRLLIFTYLFCFSRKTLYSFLAPAYNSSLYTIKTNMLVNHSTP